VLTVLRESEKTWDRNLRIRTGIQAVWVRRSKVTAAAAPGGHRQTGNK